MCEVQLRGDPQLAASPGIFIIGFSQGGLYARALVETCNVSFSSLLTFGTPHSGISALPTCEPAGDPDISIACRTWAALLSKSGVYSSFSQHRIVPAQYYRQPQNDSAFLAHSSFLPWLNNLLVEDGSNALRRSAITSLKRFVMWQWTNDMVVSPAASSWFAHEVNGTIVPLEEQPLYTDDLLGLRELDQSGRLLKRWIDGQHMHLTLDWFSDNVVKPYISDEGNSEEGGSLKTAID
jgi:palmitoyl-protein thioesterase